MTETNIVDIAPKRKPPAAGRGRPKGSLNKTTLTVKDAIAKAGEELGGALRLAEWAREDPANEKAFWTVLYLKLLPLQVSGAGENGEHLVSGIAIKLVKAHAD
ncbi:hypothetical protein [Undibacterium sp. TJN19]|uniref:hypothetical protein n=1 Tax=Undibacterium sp. TJN19 TaxID=3413055 RepID=UPI003BF2CAA2